MAGIEDESWLSAIISEYVPLAAENSKVVELQTHERSDCINTKCKKCGIVFTEKSVLECHEKSCTSERHTCQECGKCFKNSQQLRWHKKSHGVVSKKCSKRLVKRPDTYSLDNALSEWERSNPSVIENNVTAEDLSEKVTVKNVQIQEDLDDNADSDRYTCSQCGTWYSNCSELLEHIRTHTQMKVLTCQDCDRRFTNTAALMEHSRMHDEQHKPYPCDVCNKRFKYKSSMKEHQVRHTITHMYSCTICHKVYNQNLNLQKHIQVHHSQHLRWHKKSHGDVSKKCSTRLVKQPDAYSLDDALSEWEPSNPSVIDVENNVTTEDLSEKVTVKNVQIQEDLDDNAESDRYTCSQCGTWYSNSSELLEHIHTHTQMKVLTCQDCDRRFTNTAALMEHSRMHDEHHNPYTCDVCNKRFKYKTSMKQHRVRHTITHPYSCTICHKVYKQNFNLQKHIEVHHS